MKRIVLAVVGTLFVLAGGALLWLPQVGCAAAPQKPATEPEKADPPQENEETRTFDKEKRSILGLLGRSEPAKTEPESQQGSGDKVQRGSVNKADIPPGGKVAVLDFSAKSGITQDVADALADLVANSVRGYGSYSVIGKSDLQTLVGYEKVKDQMGCDDVSCLAEIGGALGVDLMVAGNVAKFGGSFLINLRLIEPRKAQVASGVSRSVADGEAGLLRDLPLAVDELFGR